MYTYLALDPEEIRILTVLPGTFGSEIHIELSHTELDVNNPPSYEALSYTWGSYDLSHLIQVDTQLGEESFAVTGNLHSALQHLRSKSSPRTLWVDAACINQRNDEERSQQVARMADIYRSAAKVLIWLGPAADNSAEALEALETLASKIHVDMGTLNVSAASEKDIESEWLDHTKPAPFDYQTWVSIGRVLDRSWFSRLWVWQEVSLAQNGAIVICGDNTMSWGNFCKAIASLVHRPNWNSIPNLIKNIDLSSQLCRPKRVQTLRFILEDSRDAKCSDQRDKIYGVLSLVNESSRLGIKPDYTKTTVQVFQDVMLNSISTIGDLSWLTCCELQGERDEIPSWVPNWSIPRRSPAIMTTFACLSTAAQATYNHRDGYLSATGLHVGRILKVQQHLIIDSSYSWEPETTLQRMILWLRNELGSDDFDRQIGAVWRTLRCNIFSDRWEPVDTSQPTFHDSLEQFRILVDPKAQSDSGFLTSCEFRSAKTEIILRNRSIIITEKGQLGLAPQASCPGDLVVVFLGCRSPMVLRPEGNSAYIVVGDAYVDGLMTGEALLGPLPSNWQCFYRYDESTGGHWKAFTDRGRDHWQSEDPRLGPLPEGWVEDEHPNQHLYAHYRDVKDDYTTWSDPRMLPSALRARNVEVTEFKLV